MPDPLAPIALPSCPQPGQAAPRLNAGDLDVFAQMAACQQDPVHHAEGDVLAHTQLVCDALVADPAWRTLGERDRVELWLAAVLHDCGKFATTRIEDGRIVSPNHAQVGSVIARSLLWRAGLDPAARERVCALVRWHMAPYHLLTRPDAIRRAIEISLTARPDLLAILVRADMTGRVALSDDRGGDEPDLMVEYCRELGCANGPYPFANDHSRVMYFRREDRDPAYAAYDDTRCQLTVLSGLAGAGKDRWACRHVEGQAVISLDDLRRADSRYERGDRKAEGRIVAQARELLRDELRNSRDCVWNATSLSRMQRGKVLGIAADYNARVRIVCVEAGVADLRAQNAGRAHPVDEAGIARMLHAWEFPTPVEAHRVEIAQA